MGKIKKKAALSHLKGENPFVTRGGGYTLTKRGRRGVKKKERFATLLREKKKTKTQNKGSQALLW